MFRTPAIGRFDETDLERSGNTLLTKKYDTKNNRSKYGSEKEDLGLKGITILTTYQIYRQHSIMD